MAGKHQPKANGWLTTQDTCALLGVTLRTLYRLIDSGQLAAYKVGRVIRLRQPDVDAYLESVRIKPGDLEHLYPHGGV